MQNAASGQISVDKSFQSHDITTSTLNVRMSQYMYLHTIV